MRIKTERLCVKSMRRVDYDDFSKIVVDFRSGDYSMYNPPLPQDDEMLNFFYGYLEYLDTFGIYLNDEMIGVVTVTVDDDQFEIGYMFKNKYHGKGYAYEGTKAVIDSLIQQYEDYNVQIVAGTATKNIPSIKLLDKLGFRCTSIEEVSFVEGVVIEGRNYVLEY